MTEQRDTYTCYCVQFSETIYVGVITGAFICVPERRLFMQEQKVEQEIDITKLSNEFTYRKYMMSRDSYGIYFLN